MRNTWKYSDVAICSEQSPQKEYLKAYESLTEWIFIQWIWQNSFCLSIETTFCCWKRLFSFNLCGWCSEYWTHATVGQLKTDRWKITTISICHRSLTYFVMHCTLHPGGCLFCQIFSHTFFNALDGVMWLMIAMDPEVWPCEDVQ